jgi:hypothetical protein
MGHYSFHGLSLEVEPEDLESRANLTRVFGNLSLVPTDRAVGHSHHRLRIRLHDELWKPPPAAKLLCEVDGFSTFEDAGGFYRTDGSSVFHILSDSSEAHVYLAPSFYDEPFMRQWSFWSFGWLKLLRPLGFYSLHAAGLVAPEGQGILVTGTSGSGKSTLTLGLMRHGWRYLSDDAIVLHSAADGICALALRKHFYIDSADSSRNSDLPLDRVRIDGRQEPRRRVRLEETPLERQRVSGCIPQVILCSRIVPEPYTTLVPMDDRTVLKQLLEGSAPEIFDRRTMGEHLQTLNALLRQCRSYELRAGRDLYDDPRILTRLLTDAAKERETTWPALLSS